MGDIVTDAVRRRPDYAALFDNPRGRAFVRYRTSQGRLAGLPLPVAKTAAR